MSSAARLVAAEPVDASPPGALSFIADRGWFDRSAAAVAEDLLGALLVHDGPQGRISGRIVEVEAYLGPEDLAAHSSRGRTARNAVMFGPPGHLYVYLVYGIHHCCNVVCGPGAKPEAVLLRAAAVTDGERLARARRGNVPATRLASGPGNLASAFGIDRRLNGADLLAGPVRIARGPRAGDIMRTPRIGVGYAAKWAARPLRYLVADEPHRSGR
ncbi:MAG TPA: DNA-3-methyladenine glycosylase [Candidatus Limnocylindria bacterium]|nr:DNA-3-methyladenine glycosylase [Candidatus Limnocylindria bacterium]